MRKYRLFGYFVAFLSITACLDEVYLDLPTIEPKLVLTAHFTAGEELKAFISLSQLLTAQNPPQLPAGVITLKEANGQPFDTLVRDTTPGGRVFWRSRKLLTAGVLYTIIADFLNYPTATASDSIPFGISDLSLILKKDSIRTLEDTGGVRILRVPVRIEIGDLPTQRRYFAFGFQHELKKKDAPQRERRPSSFLANGRTLALTYNTPENLFLLNENYWNDGRKILEVEVVIPYRPNEETPVRLWLEWRTLSEAYYRYHLSLATQGSPLSDPDALFNNVRGGYGNFSGFARLQQSAELPP